MRPVEIFIKQQVSLILAVPENTNMLLIKENIAWVTIACTHCEDNGALIDYIHVFYTSCLGLTKLTDVHYVTA